jgi:hypothetical protein
VIRAQRRDPSFGKRGSSTSTFCSTDSRRAATSNRPHASYATRAPQRYSRPARTATWFPVSLGAATTSRAVRTRRHFVPPELALRGAAAIGASWNRVMTALAWTRVLSPEPFSRSVKRMRFGENQRARPVRSIGARLPVRGAGPKGIGLFPGDPRTSRVLQTCHVREAGHVHWLPSRAFAQARSLRRQ